MVRFTLICLVSSLISWTFLPTTFLCLNLPMATASEHRSSSASVSSATTSHLNKQSDHHHSRTELDNLVKDAIRDVRKVLVTRTERFDEFFRELLKHSKRDFHHMFLQTYGLLYERNSYIFTDMFADLEKYYMSGGVDLTEALDGFFQRLYQKMFQVLNAQYTFDDNYLQCIEQLMDELKPFGDIPKKLKIEVKRSFVATRTFVQALTNGRDVLNHIVEIAPTFDCGKSLLKMSNCPQCQASGVKACPSLCVSVMSNCLSGHSDLNKEWNNYIDALLLLSSRLETSFNIESVVDPIDIKISEAIMNFQENGVIVSQKLFEKCGKPRIGKRAAVSDRSNGEELMDNGFDDFNTYRSHHQQQQPHASRMVAAGTSMERLINDIKRKLRKTKDFWVKLPSNVCSNSALSSSISGSSSSSSSSSASSRDQRSCWNGTDIVQKDLDRLAEPLNGNDKRHRVGVKHTRQNAVISQQLLTLKLITTKVNYAYNGLEVEWQDNGGANTDHVSGSGSGAGSDEDVDADEDSYSPPISHHNVHSNAGSHGHGMDTSDSYLSSSSPETSGPSSSSSSTTESNFVPTNVPNAGHPAKSTRLPNRINVINYNHRQRASNHASPLSPLTSLSVYNVLISCTVSLLMLFTTRVTVTM
ncbi:Glypican-6 [Halotydeus destructor]|nr:Glypican-6 [Halotydeus destructor]